MGKPGPKAKPLDDPVAEAKRQRKREQRMASYYANHDSEKEKRRTYQAERRAAGYNRYESEQTHYLKYRYGITLEDYDRMLLEQDGKCAVCGTTDTRNGKGRFDIDHNHETGQVRGLLCGKCNRGIGMLDDSIDRVTQVLSYLMSFESVLQLQPASISVKE